MTAREKELVLYIHMEYIVIWKQLSYKYING